MMCLNSVDELREAVSDGTQRFTGHGHYCAMLVEGVEELDRVFSAKWMGDPAGRAHDLLGIWRGYVGDREPHGPSISACVEVSSKCVSDQLGGCSSLSVGSLAQRLA